MVKLCFDVSDIIHVNEHAKYANSGVQVNFRNFLLVPFCFLMKKEKNKLKERKPTICPCRLSKASVLSGLAFYENIFWNAVRK